MTTENPEVVEGIVVENTMNIGKTAAHAVKKGTHAAKKAATKVAISPIKLANRAVYGVCYGLAYGAVYSALVVSKVFPDNGVVSKGLHEGSESAIKDFEAKQAIVDSTVVNA